MANTPYQISIVIKGLIRSARLVYQNLGIETGAVPSPEVIYQCCLALELEHSRIPIHQEPYLPFHSSQQEKEKRKDFFLVAGWLMVKIKAEKELNSSDVAQLFDTLRTYGLEEGVLINFGSREMEVSRVQRNY